MLELTLLEKFKILFDLILASPFFIFLFIFTILAFIVLLDTKNYDKIKVKKYIVGIYAVVFIAAIIKYHSSFLSLFDYLMNNVAILFYFPNLTVYAVIIIIANMIMLKTIFKYNDKVERTLNIAMYSTIMYLMLITLSTITTETIDIYDQVSLYSNSNILALVELSNTIFLIWILLLIINKLLDILETKGLKIKSKLFPESHKVITEYITKEVPIERIIYKDKQPEMFTKEEYALMLSILKNKSE